MAANKKQMQHWQIQIMATIPPTRMMRVSMLRLITDDLSTDDSYIVTLEFCPQYHQQYQMHSHVHPSINTCTRNINPIYNDLWTHPMSVKAARALIHTAIGAPSDGFKCDQCDHVFVQKVNLNVHKKIHTECASVCQFCDKKFARKSNLQQHLHIHTDARPYRCEKPYHCAPCNKKYALKSRYNAHMRKFHMHPIAKE
eukprot:537500_1